MPFCAAKCRYCDFFSVPIDGEDGLRGLATRVVERTVAQIDWFLERAPAVRFATAYLGGGTPSVLPPRLLERLLGRLSDLAAEEWTVEANPESLDRPFLDACASAGVTRLSIGLQSMDDRLLTMLGRPGTARDNRRALEMVATRWHGEASCDLITGIPGQSLEGVTADVEAVARSGAGHASLYSLTVEPGTPLAGLVGSGTVALNTRDHDDDLWLAGRAVLEEAGLRQYEVSNFARAGAECRHNLRYWRLEPYLGVGPGAVSTLPPDLAAALTGRCTDAAVVRLENPRDLSTFVAGPNDALRDGAPARPWGIEAEAVSGASFMLETLMTGLRLVDGIGAETFRRRFGADLDRIVPGIWAGWVRRGLASPDTGSLRLTDRGLLLLDRLLGELAQAMRAGGLPAVTVRWPDGEAGNIDTPRGLV